MKRSFVTSGPDFYNNLYSTRYKIQEFYSPILGSAREYKDDAHERREIQTIEWKRVLAITMYDILY